MTELAENKFELEGVDLTQWTITEWSGLEDVAEVEDTDTDALIDGTYAGSSRLAPREIGIGISVIDETADLAERAAAIHAAINTLKTVVGPRPNRAAGVLLRWRHAGDITKRITVWPNAKPLVVPGTQERFGFFKAQVGIRLLAYDPIVLSDELHQVTFAAGEIKTITNAGTFAAVLPCAWELSAPVPVTIERLDDDDQPTGELVRFPTGPVTVDRYREVIAPGTYASCFGAGGNWLPRWPVLPPGDSRWRASAECTYQWRDTFA